jgi:hypothetical protein
MEIRVVSKKERTVSAILPPFQQKSIHIVMTDPFSGLPCPFNHLSIIPCSGHTNTLLFASEI